MKVQSFNQREDRELVQLFAAGNNQAFETLTKRYKVRIMTAIFNIVRDRSVAEDLYQETLIKIVDTIRAGRYNEQGRFLPWALRVARNLSIDYFRRTRKYQITPILESTEDVRHPADDGFDNLFIRKENKAMVRDLISKLPTRQREVLILRHYNDMSFKEIADYTNVSINTALGRMRYALVNLKRMADEQQIRL